MSRDPILSAHLVGEKCFEIGGEFSPASIRDQMLRAYLVADRAHQAGIINGTKRPLLVVGAGPSGLTAAVRAAELGVTVVVAERRRRNAFLLGGCASRDVEPTLYDWPVNHWAQGVFEWRGAHFQFQWRAGRASLIAVRWQRDLTAILTHFGSLIDLRYDTFPILRAGRAPAVASSSLVNVRLSQSGVLSRHRFGGLISCVGFGDENCTLDDYSGFRFWETDAFERPNCGLKSPPSIVISGGGDGALQDFIRIVTGRGTGQVFLGFLRALSPYPWLLESTQSDLQSAEDVAVRALSWNEPQHDGVVLARLETAHERAIDRLQRSPAAWAAISQVLRAMFPARLPILQLLHRGPHFSQCYPLNRFLTLLILRLTGTSTIVRRPGAEVNKVSGTGGHACAKNASACHGQPHEVEYTQNGATTKTKADVVILRHGILGPKSLFTGVQTSRKRQILPYYVEA